MRYTLFAWELIRFWHNSVSAPVLLCNAYILLRLNLMDRIPFFQLIVKQNIILISSIFFGVQNNKCDLYRNHMKQNRTFFYSNKIIDKQLIRARTSEKKLFYGIL